MPIALQQAIGDSLHLAILCYLQGILIIILL